MSEPIVSDAVNTSEPATGVILAGGHSHRFGVDKAGVLLEGKPLAQWVLESMRHVTIDQVVVTRRGGPVIDLGTRVVEDQLPTRGALAGIHAGLKAAETDLCIVVACDLPLVRPELLRLLISSVGSKEAAVPCMAEVVSGDLGADVSTKDIGLQPLCAAYRTPCVAAIENLLQEGPSPAAQLARSVDAKLIGARLWRPVDPGALSFVNVNTQADLLSAAQMMRGSQEVMASRGSSEQQWRLRPATQDDLEFLFRVLRVTLGPYVEMTYGGWDHDEQWQRFTDSAVTETHEIIELGDMPIGCLWAQPTPEAVKLNRILLLPDYQRRGIGTEIVEHVILSADTEGLPVTLRVMRVNPALSLYERLGFRLVGETETHFLMST